MKSHIKTAKMKLPFHEFSFVKATAPFFDEKTGTSGKCGTDAAWSFL